MEPKTNSMRYLDTAGVPYEVYTFSPNIHSAIGVAEATGLPPEQVFKTLVVVRSSGKPLLVIVPGHRELSLKALATHIGEKKLRMATQHEAEALTGLQVGGISALALLDRRFAVYLDESALSFNDILVSAGRRGVNLRLDPGDFVRVTNAAVVSAAASPPGDWK